MVFQLASPCSIAAVAAVANVPRSGGNNARIISLAIACCILFSAMSVSAFAPSAGAPISNSNHATNTCDQFVTQHVQPSQTSTRLHNLFPKDDFEKDDFLDDDDDSDVDYAVKAQVSKAKALLRDAKKKLEEKQKAEQMRLEAAALGDDSNSEAENSNDASSLPFFASRSFTSSASETSKKIKKTTKNGIVADGETMASLSKSEPWERRSLNQMFKNEIESEEEAATKALLEKDLAMGIYNLRKTLQTEDFKRVFDSRNRFIGEID